MASEKKRRTDASLFEIEDLLGLSTLYSGFIAVKILAWRY